MIEDKIRHDGILKEHSEAVGLILIDLKNKTEINWVQINRLLKTTNNLIETLTPMNEKGDKVQLNTEHMKVILNIILAEYHRMESPQYERGRTGTRIISRRYGSIYIQPKFIKEKIIEKELCDIESFGKYPESAIGKALNHLGFMEKVRTGRGYDRIIPKEILMLRLTEYNISFEVITDK